MRIANTMKSLVRTSAFAGIFLFLAGAQCCTVVPTASVIEPMSWILRYRASDKMLQTDATTLLSLKIAGQYNVDGEYRFKVGPEASIDCAAEAGYSAWTNRSQRLEADISADPDGIMRLCVVARGKNNCNQMLTQPVNKASFYRWKKVTNTAPAPFSITGPTGMSTSLSQTIAWQASTGALSYDLKVARQPDCSDVAVEHLNLTATSQAVTLPADGAYFSCVTAKKGTSPSTAATNNGFQFTIDSTPPGAFNITAPTGTQATAAVMSEWSAAAGASEYKVQLHSANNCNAGSMISESTVTSTSSAVAAPGDGTFFLCAWAKDAAGNGVIAGNSPYSFQVVTVVEPPVETIIKDSASNAACWRTSPSPFISHQFNDSSPNLWGHAAFSFTGNGGKLSRIGTLVMHNNSAGLINGGDLQGVGWAVLFYGDTATFQSDPNLLSQPTGSISRKVASTEPSNANYLTKVGNFGGSNNFNIYYVEFDVSGLDIRTVAGAQHLVALVPAGGSSAGNFHTLFAASSCAGSGSDWYKFPPSVNPVPNSLANLGAPASTVTSLITTLP